MQDVWAQVDRYFCDLLLPRDANLDAVLGANSQAGLPAIDIPPLMGKFLELLVRISGARRVLEVGTLGGYSTIWLARALPAGGKVISLELELRHAEIARSNLEGAGMLDRVEVRVGLAADSLRELVESGAEPFDFIFIDADKESYTEYLDWALKLSRSGTVIVADNLVRDGKVVQADCTDPFVVGVKRFAEQMAKEPRLSSTVIQTVGARGYDGFSVAVVNS